MLALLMHRNVIQPFVPNKKLSPGKPGLFLLQRHFHLMASPFSRATEAKWRFATLHISKRITYIAMFLAMAQ